MKLNFEIDDEPENVNLLLSNFTKDDHLSKTFEGTIKDGRIEGIYTNLALINGLVIGYTKIRGKYDLEKGQVSLRFLPSNLFWLAISFSISAIIIFSLKNFESSISKMVGCIFFSSLGTLFTLFFFIEGQSFIKQIKRVYKAILENKNN